MSEDVRVWGAGVHTRACMYVCLCVCLCTSTCEEVATEAWILFLKSLQQYPHRVSQSLTLLALTFRTQTLVCPGVQPEAPPGLQLPMT